MSGPFVRSGPSTRYVENWENAFGRKKSQATGTSAKPRVKVKKAKRKKK
jgi:hypothetical protein